MAVPFVLMAAGTALQVYGNYQANMAQAKAELLNAEFYKQQADFVKQAEFRQSAITAAEYEYKRGAQVSAYAKGNVAIGGSVSGVLAESLARKVDELTAIKQKGDLEYTLASARAKQSAEMADRLQSFGYNLTQAGTTTLTNAATYAAKTS